MSEPDISNLARNLAEQNNVDWRKLIGSGPDGRVVERDVLDYLARVMAGEEALDPTPEPLPEGMEAWPDQDAPSYFTGGSAVGAAADLVDDLADGEVVTEPDYGAFGAASQAADYVESVEPVREDAAEAAPRVADVLEGAPADPWLRSATDLVDDAPVFGAGVAEDDEVSADIFLFDEDDDDDVYGSGSQGQEADVFTGSAPAETGAEYAGLGQADGGVASYGQPAHEEEWGADDVVADADEVLLVADDDLGSSAGFGSGVEEEVVTPYRYSFEQTESADVVDTPLGAYDKEFTTPGEQLSGDAADEWGTGDYHSDLSSGSGFDDDLVGGSGDLPDLWDNSAEPSGGDEASFEAAADMLDAPAEAAATEHAGVEAFGDDAGLGGAGYSRGRAYEAEETEAVEGRGYQTGSADEGLAEQIVDDIEDLEQAEALDELDAVGDLTALDGDVEAEPAAAVAAAVVTPDQPAGPALPLARTGTMLRRHVDLSALAGAQLAVGQELGLGEPIGVAAFLLRAAAKAVGELGGVDGQVALAEVGAELTFRRVDEAAGSDFAALVEELAGSGSEEDELGLAVVDLSGYDMDEVILNVEVPTLTLGRVLYDTQRGAHRSTLTLSGDLPFDQGAKLLARVADLLDAPVRLFV